MNTQSIHTPHTVAKRANSRKKADHCRHEDRIPGVIHVVDAGARAEEPAEESDPVLAQVRGELQGLRCPLFGSVGS